MSGEKLNGVFSQAAQMFSGSDQPVVSPGKPRGYVEGNQRGYIENPGSFESAQCLRVRNQFRNCADYNREIPLGRDVYEPSGERFIVPGAGFGGSEFREPTPASPNMPGSLTAQPQDQYPSFSYENPGMPSPVPFGYGR